MLSHTLFEWGLIFIAAFGSGFLIRTIGSGVGITLTPLLTLAFPPRFSLGLIAFTSFMTSMGMIPAMWGLWHKRTILLVFPGAAAGILGGTWLVARLPDTQLRAVIGVLCLFFALHRIYVELTGKVPEAPPLPPWLGVMIGGLSGFTSATANSGAVVLSLFLHSQNLSKTMLLGTLWALYFFVNPLKLVAYWQTQVITTDTVWAGLAGFPFLWAGLRMGAWTHDRIPLRAFNLSILGLALAGSLRLLLAP